MGDDAIDRLALYQGPTDQVTGEIMSVAGNTTPTDARHNLANASSAAVATAASGKPAALPIASQAKPISATQAFVVQAPREPVQVRITESPTDYIGPCIAFFAALVTAGLGWIAINWQLKRQRKDAQNQHRENTKAQLRLDAYKDFQLVLARFYACESPNVRLALIRNQLDLARNASSQGQTFRISARAMDFGEKLNQLLTAIAELRLFIERYESMLPGFDIFSTALAVVVHDAIKHRAALDVVFVKWLPVDFLDANGGKAMRNIQRIDSTALQELEIASAPMIVAINKGKSWVFDLAVDAQNFLLGNYADQTVQRRKPVDQIYFTVTIDANDRDRLNALFDDTDYARANAASMAYAHARYATAKDFQTTPSNGDRKPG